jgi:GMP synthase (glutamine-hydrolysing)
MKKLLVCQHVPYEVLGTLDPLFRAAGFRIKYANFGRFPNLKPTLDGYHGLVVLGGPMNVDEDERYPNLKYELTLIEDAMKRDLPVLGICLGSQLVAKALGAKVCHNHEKEIGWYDLNLTEHAARDPIFRHFRASEKIFQWHGDTFDLPQGAVHLAKSELCDKQAFRYGDKVYGFQFHLEVDEALIERWLTVPENVKELQMLEGKIDPNHIREITPHHISRLKDLSENTFQEFIKLFGIKKTRRHLPSR